MSSIRWQGEPSAYARETDIPNQGAGPDLFPFLSEKLWVDPWCRSEFRPDFIAVAQDWNGDGIYEDAEVNWFSVSPEETLKIATILKWIGSRVK
jgi:hypothetical protein